MNRMLILAVLSVAGVMPQTSQAQTPFGFRVQIGNSSFSLRNGYSYPTYVAPSYITPGYVSPGYYGPSLVPRQTIIVPSPAYPSWYGPGYLDYGRWNSGYRHQLYPPTHGNPYHRHHHHHHYHR